MKKINNPCRLIWLLNAALIIIVDQASKTWFSQHLAPGEVWRVCAYFNFRIAHNTGAAFSFLSHAGGWQQIVFTGLALAVCLFLLHWLLTSTGRWLGFAISLVVGGALGNIIDRIQLHYVIDFIDWHIGAWHWPTFNIADSAIVVGMLILIIQLLFSKT